MIQSTRSLHRKQILLDDIHKLENNMSIFLQELTLIDAIDPDIKKLVDKCEHISSSLNEIKRNLT